MTNSHSTMLMAKHARLDERLRDEQHRVRPDSTLVAMLKKQKLKIKEALSRL
ncbi:YdcH family protein [uncultured Sphingomonas sp.]|uniref:YdcH family protein n=1 Tax=uncultured Sphingomonas sp. TaxID=158754 RepID=UPI0025EE16EB|nr:YdcH family protein [uncultured Sphingomonas sp.]